MTTAFESPSSTSCEQQKLTQDYLYLMDELHKVLAITTIPEEEFLIHEWKDKFINDFFARVDAGRTRNLYIAKFIECLRNKRLSGPFRALPPYGDLPEFKSSANKVGPPDWLTKMEKDQWITTTGRPFKQYFARKSLDYGRGTCVCISIAFAPSRIDNNCLQAKFHKMGAPDTSYRTQP